MQSPNFPKSEIRNNKEHKFQIYVIYTKRTKISKTNRNYKKTSVWVCGERAAGSARTITVE